MHKSHALVQLYCNDGEGLVMLAINHQAPAIRLGKRRLKLEHFFGEEAKQVSATICKQFSSTYPSFTALPESLMPAAAHIAIGTDRITGRVMGFITGECLSTTSEPFLYFKQIAIDRSCNSHSLLRRLIAVILLRAVGIEEVPVALAFAAAAEWLSDAFLTVADHFPGAVCYPPPNNDIINLATARLARQIAKVVAPSIRYDVATSLLLGARAASRIEEYLLAKSGTSATFDLTAGDQVTLRGERLLIIDFRLKSGATLIDDARQAYQRL